MIRAIKTNTVSGIVVEGWPKIGRFFAIAGLAAALANGTVACTSTGEEESGEEVVEEEAGNEEAAVAEEGNTAAESGNAVAGEAPANATAEAPVEEPAVNTAAVDAPANAAGTDALAADALPPVDAGAAATDPAATAPAESAPAAPAAAATTAQSGPGLPAGTNAVVYVGGAQVAVYDAPNGREVGRMARGDYVLASAEGEWAKTSDGRYIRSSDLQVAPVGRKKVQSRWRSPRAH
jgi:hypothetical protein